MLHAARRECDGVPDPRWICLRRPLRVQILLYQPGASVPLHEHIGWEHVLVLEGEQADERGRYPAGTLLMNPPGSKHSVRSETGCAALLYWEKPVRIIG